MPSPELSDSFQEEIRTLLSKGYTIEAVWRFVKDEGAKYADSGAALKKSIENISKRMPGACPCSKALPAPPAPASFDSRPYASVLKKVYKGMPNRDLEARGKEVGMDLLAKKEGFSGVCEGPAFRGTPFDLFGFKEGKPYVVELKCSLVGFHHPGEIQKVRLQELMRRIQGLGAGLLQLNLSDMNYRLFYDEQLDLLFHGKRMPLGPIESWIRERL